MKKLIMLELFFALLFIIPFFVWLLVIDWRIGVILFFISWGLGLIVDVTKKIRAVNKIEEKRLEKKIDEIAEIILKKKKQIN